MIRRSVIRRAHVDPELSKYYHASFHDGHHRQAPRTDEKAWQDRKSPIRRFWEWYSQPVYKGSVAAAWACTGLLGYYCACVADDAKSTYMVNTALQRALHLESMKAQESSERLTELQKTMLKEDEEGTEEGKDRREARREMAQRPSVVNYELELTRERKRADELAQRNNKLVSELVATRNELRAVTKRRNELEGEVKKLAKYVEQLHLD